MGEIIPQRPPVFIVSAFITALAAGCANEAVAQPSGGAEVSFQSREGTDRTPTLRGVLWVPEGKAKGAVVLVHGSSGWTDHREGHWGRALMSAGYAALAIDSFGPRGIVETTEDQSQISPYQMTRDAYAARRLLIAQGFPWERIAVMGFSKGGIVALYAADRSGLPKGAQAFVATIAFYPGCNIRVRKPKPFAVVFMALGEKDDWTGVKPCEDLASAYAQAGGKITTKIYPGAAHGFDGDPARTGLTYLRTVENYIDCLVFREEDDSLTYAGKRYAQGDPSLLADMRKTCVKKGASVWTNQHQKEVASRDVINFLAGIFP